jgi:hypothetical protein
MKYRKHFTSRPGLYKGQPYEFELTDETPSVQHTRAIPYSLRPHAKEQIDQMMEDGILELSKSPFVNPLTIVCKPGKIRICIDARKINSSTIGDAERAQPIQELIQRFHGVKFMTNLDLSSSFWQIPLKRECRKYTAFLFDSTLYQFKRVPFGFRNSQAALIRSLKQVLGPETSHFIVLYVDDIVIFSSSFDEHLQHIDRVLFKLTSAGFTINLKKCEFCKTQIKFLGHIISPAGVAPDPDRIAAILN